MKTYVVDTYYKCLAGPVNIKYPRHMFSWRNKKISILFVWEVSYLELRFINNQQLANKLLEAKS